jgi:hypothetical protein
VLNPLENFIDLHLKPHVLSSLGLPEMPYPVPADDMDSALAADGELPLAAMLHALQQLSSKGDTDWLSLEPAMDRLTTLLAPDDDRDVISAAGEEWWIEIGPVDINGKIVTIQRQDKLIAAIASREDGRLRVMTFRPLDAKSARYMIGLSQIPHPKYGVQMRENNWELALDSSAGMGNIYASERGEAYLSFWEKGLGKKSDGKILPDWFEQKKAIARQPAHVATEIGISYAFSQE